MASRKEQKEQLRREREEREAAERAAGQRKRLIGYAAGAAVVILALAVAGFALMSGGDDEGGGQQGGGEIFPEGGDLAERAVTDLPEAAAAAGCELTATKSRGEQDRLHTDGPDVTVNYQGNPPTLGRHWPPGFEAEDGLYQEAPADGALVHTMEHGRVIIWAKPTLQEDARSSLRAFFDEEPYQLVLTPRPEMPYAVAATAWNAEPQPGGTGRTMGCPTWNAKVVDALRAFRDEHRSNGPEPVP